MIHIGVCDDDKYYWKQIENLCENYFEGDKDAFHMSFYNNGQEFLVDDCNKELQILFLDIEMPVIDGISLKNLLMDEKKEVLIIYLTCHIENMHEAFGTNVIEFISKPIDEQIIKKVLKKAIGYIEDDKKILVNTICGKSVIFSRDIMFIRAENKCSVIYTQKDRYVDLRTLNNWEQELFEKDFYRIHKSVVVNMKYIERLKNCQIILDNGVELKISRRNRKDFEEMFFEYCRRKAK